MKIHTSSTLSVLLFLCFGSFVHAQPTTYSNTAPYIVGDLVVSGSNTYIAIAKSTGQTPPNTSYWTDLSVAANALNIPTEAVPTLDTDTILSSLPGFTPDGGVSSGGKIINLSTRGYVGTGTKRLIGGFKVYGGDCKIIVRAFGPSRNNPDNLDNPFLTWKTNPTSLYGSDGIISTVDNKADNSRLSGQNSSTQTLIDGLLPLESADIQTASNWSNDLSKGYTAFVTPSSGEAGVGRIGINDISDGTGGELLNISTRGFVGATSAQYLIAGFQIRSGSVKVVIQAFGPSRPNSDALVDPVIELIRQVSSFHTTKSTIAMNDDFNSDFSGKSTESGESVTTPMPSIPTSFGSLVAKESCIVITLEPGDYTARVYGKGGGTGIGRVGINKVIE